MRLLLERNKLLKLGLKCQEGSQNNRLTPSDLKISAEKINLV